MNLMINGDMSIWERGNLFPNQPGGAYSADRWTYSNKPVGKVWHTISRDYDVPSVIRAGRKFLYSQKLECTSAVFPPLSPDLYVALLYKIIGYNAAKVMGQRAELGFWIKGSQPGVYGVAVSNYAGNDRYYLSEYSINSPETWEWKSLIIPMHDGESGTWNFGNGAGIGIFWTLASGKDHILGPPYRWSTGPNCATPSQINACADVGDYIKITGVHFGTPETRLIEQELLICQAYYERHGGATGTFPMLAQYAGAGNAAAIGIPFRALKRDIPRMAVRGNWFTANCSMPVAVNPSRNGYMFSVTAINSGTVACYPTDDIGIIEATCEL